MDTFGKRLKHLIDKKEISQAELSKIFNTTPTTIGRYVKDIRFPDQETLVKLSDFFNVSLDYLLCKTDDPNMNIKYIKIKNSEIEIEIDGEHKKIDEKKLLSLIEKLDSVGFDVKKLL